jgi:LuxR family quorum-sensing transcriptional regulator LasR
MSSIERYAALLQCGSEKTWQKIFFQLARDHGFKYALIALIPRRNMSLEAALLHSNYPKSWRNAYDHAKLAYIDPTVTHCLRQSTPLIWGAATFIGKQQQAMYEAACDYGLRSGIALPYHGASGEAGILCFADDLAVDGNFLRESEHLIPALTLLRDYAFESLRRFIKPEAGNPSRPHLTHREMECLNWCSLGKSSWDIARILKCSESAVNFHFSNLRKKFDSTSRRQVVIKAIRLGMIQH